MIDAHEFEIGDEREHRFRPSHIKEVLLSSYCRNREVFMELTRGSTQYKSTAINANPSET